MQNVAAQLVVSNRHSSVRLQKLCSFVISDSKRQRLMQHSWPKLKLKILLWILKPKMTSVKKERSSLRAVRSQACRCSRFLADVLIQDVSLLPSLTQGCFGAQKSNLWFIASAREAQEHRSCITTGRTSRHEKLKLLHLDADMQPTAVSITVEFITEDNDSTELYCGSWHQIENIFQSFWKDLWNRFYSFCFTYTCQSC